MDICFLIPSQVLIPIPGLSRPTTLDFHFRENYIYFSDSQTYKIQRAKILGEAVVTEDFITEGLNKVIIVEFTALKFENHNEVTKSFSYQTKLCLRLRFCYASVWVVTILCKVHLAPSQNFIFVFF